MQFSNLFWINVLEDEINRKSEIYFWIYNQWQAPFWEYCLENHMDLFLQFRSQTGFWQVGCWGLSLEACRRIKYSQEFLQPFCTNEKLNCKYSETVYGQGTSSITVAWELILQNIPLSIEERNKDLPILQLSMISVGRVLCLSSLSLQNTWHNLFLNSDLKKSLSSF